MLHNAALLGKQMKSQPSPSRTDLADDRELRECDEIDRLDFFTEPSRLYHTASTCLMSKKFRNELDGRFVKLY